MRKGAVFTVDGIRRRRRRKFQRVVQADAQSRVLAHDGGLAAAYKVLWQNIRDLISPPKLPPLKVTSQPVKVKDIWTKDKAFGPSQAIALAVHIGITVLIFSPLLYTVVTKATANPVNNTLVTPIDISDYAMKLPPGKDKAGGGGGGGERNPLPATKGKAPKFSMKQIAPPMVHTKPDSNIQATLLGPPDLKIPSPNMDNYGDPLAKLMNGSGGPGGGSGIGSGTGTGIGSGEGGGLGPGFRRRHGRRGLSSGNGRRRLSLVRLLPRPEIFRRSPQGEVSRHGCAPGRNHAGWPRD